MIEVEDARSGIASGVEIALAHRQRLQDPLADLGFGAAASRAARLRPLDEQLGQGVRVLPERPVAMLQVDLVEETRAELVVALPFDLRFDGADPGYLEADRSAGLQARLAARPETERREIEHVNFEAAPAVRPQPCVRVQRDPLGPAPHLPRCMCLRTHSPPIRVVVAKQINAAALTNCCLSGG